jgi:hypothetical protein
VNPNRFTVCQALERRILHGLACEWENALWVLPTGLRKKMRLPIFSLSDMESRLGYWSATRREIVLSRRLVLDYPWDCVVEVLGHETAHQLAEEIMKAGNEPAHGPSFREACRLLRANPEASGRYEPLRDRLGTTEVAPQDRILERIKKLMALAESGNPHEAESAMVKAHALIAKHNIDLMARKDHRDFVSIFVGLPALRHFREAYHLANLLEEFYFISGIWVPAYVVAKGKMGRVFEISGTARNVEAAAYVYDFVVAYIDSRWRAYNRDKRLNRYRRTDFAVGVIEGFKAKLTAEGIRQAVPDGPRALLKIEDPLLTRYMAYRHPRTTRFKRQGNRQDEAVYDEGIKAGREMVISKGITEKKGGRTLRIGLERAGRRGTVS